MVKAVIAEGALDFHALERPQIEKLTEVADQLIVRYRSVCEAGLLNLNLWSNKLLRPVLETSFPYREWLIDLSKARLANNAGGVVELEILLENGIQEYRGRARSCVDMAFGDSDATAHRLHKYFYPEAESAVKYLTTGEGLELADYNGLTQSYYAECLKADINIRTNEIRAKLIPFSDEPERWTLKLLGQLEKEQLEHLLTRLEISTCRTQLIHWITNPAKSPAGHWIYPVTAATMQSGLIGKVSVVHRWPEVADRFSGDKHFWNRLALHCSPKIRRMGGFTLEHRLDMKNAIGNFDAMMSSIGPPMISGRDLLPWAFTGIDKERFRRLIANRLSFMNDELSVVDFKNIAPSTHGKHSAVWDHFQDAVVLAGIWKHMDSTG